jgi:hypothetical protein
MRRAVLAAVIVAVASIAVARLLAGWLGNGNVPGSVTGKVVTAGAATRLPPDAVPPYFIALTATGGGLLARDYPKDITVRGTRSGQVLALVRPPEDPGTFTFVSSSTSDDRTFLVGAQPWKPFVNGRSPPDDTGQPVSFYLLRFDPASRRTSLVPLAVPTETQTRFLSASLSPDGTQLAVADLLTDNRTLAVHVYPIPAGGPGRTWTTTTPPNGAAWGTTLSWSANDRVVAVGQGNGTLWLLDTTAPTGDLVAASEAITLATGMGPADPGLQCSLSPIVLTSDGSKLACAVAADFAHIEGGGGLGPGRGGFAFYSPATGDMTAVADVEGQGQPTAGNDTPQLVWVSPRGAIVIGTTLRGPLSIISDSRPQPLRWHPDPRLSLVGSVAW